MGLIKMHKRILLFIGLLAVTALLLSCALDKPAEPLTGNTGSIAPRLVYKTHATGSHIAITEDLQNSLHEMVFVPGWILMTTRCEHVEEQIVEQSLRDVLDSVCNFFFERIHGLKEGWGIPGGHQVFEHTVIIENF